MTTAKDLIVKPISSADARAFVRAHHYSGKVANNSQLHFGVFLDGRLHGAMQFGPSLDKRKIQGLVEGTQWHEFLELNRMAFDEVLPRNSESRALAVAFRLIRKHAPQVKWIISFADATQCGDGAIYRAAGFVLTGIRENTDLVEMPDGHKLHKIVLQAGNYSAVADKRRYGHNGGESANAVIKRAGGHPLKGFQIRYIYFIDPTYRARLTVPELPYSKIDEMGAGMYLGQKRGTGETDNAPGSNRETGGASPTVPLLQES